MTAVLAAVAAMAGVLIAVPPAHAAAPDFHPRPGGIYTIENRRSGMCLSPNGPFATAGICSAVRSRTVRPPTARGCA
jgi:hypothetical protein